MKLKLKPRTFGIQPEDDVALCEVAAFHQMDPNDVLRRFVRYCLRVVKSDPARVLLNVEDVDPAACPFCPPQRKGRRGATCRCDGSRPEPEA